MKNIVFITNPNNNFSIKSWENWCQKNNCEIFILNESYYTNNLFNKFIIFDLLENENISYDQILITNTDTIINPNAPNIFNLTQNKLCGCFYDSSYNWLFRSIENYSKFMFSGATFPYYEYLDMGVIIVNKKHKSFFKKIQDFYLHNEDNIAKMDQTFRVGTDSPIFNFLLHEDKIDLKVLPYEWNMQDMLRKEVIDPNLVFTEIGWIYQFNLLQNKEYWMETTYKHLFNG